MIKNKYKRALPTLLLTLLFIASSQAATFVVTNTGDSPAPGSGSLRRAIFDAGVSAGNDVIEFDQAVFATPRIITLIDNGLPDNTLRITNFTLGDLGSLTINGRNVVTVMRSSAAGTPQFRVFTIENAAIFNDLTIANGSITTSQSIVGGAGIFINGENTARGGLTLNNCVVRDNTSTALNGGGIYNGGGPLTINNSIITNNTNTGFGAAGGGIYSIVGNNNAGTLTITNSNISGNTCGTTGGGIYNNGLMNVNNSNITGNTGGTGGGGGLTNFGGTATVNASVISGNVRGGIRNSSDFARLTVTGSTISNNTATSAGSGISSSSVGGFTRISDSVISGNTTSGTDLIGAAGITNTNSSFGTSLFSLTNCTVSGNRVIGGLADYAGGIYNGGNLTITNSTITDNEVMGGSNARAGGVISAASGVTLTVRNSIIAGNRNNANIADVRIENGGTFTSSGYNLIGNRGAVSTFNQTGDQTGTSAALINPQLAALANNGGPTFTHALLAGSTAINAGLNALAIDFNNQPITTDQRGTGFTRVSGGTVDIGAFETQAVAALVSISGRVTTPGGQNLRNAVVSLIDQNGDRRTATTSSFGLYSFEMVTPGRTYTVTVSSKRYRFAPQTPVVNDNVANLNFIGQE